MSNHYVIQWKSKVNGRAGKGAKLFSREEADRLVEELNREYPQILHEVVKAGPQRGPAEAVSKHTEPSEEGASQEPQWLSANPAQEVSVE